MNTIKRYIFVAILLLSNLAYSQMNINWGERFHEIKDNCTEAQFLAEDNDGYYFYYSLNEYIGQGETQKRYYLARTDKNGNVNKVARMDFGSNSFSVVLSWRNNDLVGFILSKSKQDKEEQSSKTRRKKNSSTTNTGKQSLYYEFVHLKDMRLIDKPQKFITYNYFADSSQAPYLVKFSENKTKLVFCLFSNDTSGKCADIRVYDNKVNMLWEKTYALKNIQMPKVKVSDVAVSNDGKRALLAINGYVTGKKINHSDDKAFLIHIEPYENKGHTLQMEKAWVTDMKCCFNLEGDYVLAGYYGTSNDKPYLASGVFAYTFDKRRHYQKNFSQVEQKDYENDNMVAPYKPNPKDKKAMRPTIASNGMVIPSMFSSYVDELVPMIGGNVIIIGEQRYHSTIQPAKRKGDKPTGENAMFYRDILITNINKDGNIDANSMVAKRQKEYRGSNDYNSYYLTRDRYGIYVMFNDHTSNYKDGTFTPNHQYDSDKLRTQVSFVQIFSDGSYNWLQCFRSKQDNREMPFYKTLFLTHDKYILFLCHHEDNNVIGKIDTREGVR